MKKLLILFIAVITVISVSKVINAQEIYDLNKHLTQPEHSSFTAPDKPTVDSQGNLNLSIALGEVPGRRISYPINLSYQSGIKVMQQSSWVGLGWNFNPGSISRVPNIGPYNYSTDEKNGVDFFDSSGNNNAPDIFSVTIPGRGSAKMVQVKEPSFTSSTIPVYETGDFLTLDHKAWKIEYQTSVVTIDGISTGERPDTYTAYDHNSKVNKADISKFLITVEDGTGYLFAEPTLSYVDVEDKVSSTTIIKRQDYVSTWRLVAIFSPEYYGNRWVVPSNTGAGSWIKLIYNGPNTDSDHPNKLQFRQTKYLSQILTRTSSASFTLSDRIEPMLGEWEKSPTFLTNDTQKKIDKIEFNIGSTATKTFEFIHDNSFNPMSNGYTDKGRLKLKEIKIKGNQGGYLPGYKFEYHSNPTVNWPYGMRYDEMLTCIDDFGYYNNSRLGWINNVSKSRCSSAVDNADSGSDSWSMSSIEYPTGSKDIINYETRSIKGDLELDFYIPSEAHPDYYKPLFSSTANDDVYVGGPQIKSIKRQSGFKKFSTDEHYYESYSYGDGTGISGIPNGFLKRRYNGSSNIIFSSNINAEIFYGRVTTKYYGGGGDGTGSFLTEDRKYYTYGSVGPITITKNDGTPCPVSYYFDDPTPQCWGMYVWSEDLSWDWGKEIDNISVDSGANISKSKTTTRNSVIAGSSNPGRTNHMWTIELGYQNYKTIELFQKASRVTSRINSEGEKYSNINYEYDPKTNLVSQKKTVQSSGSKRVKKITRAHEISNYSVMKSKNMLSQVAREDYGLETSGTTNWKSSKITTWKDQGIDTDPLFWKPWKIFLWKSNQVSSGSPYSFNEWVSGTTPSNWILNEEMKEYDAHGNIKERLFPNSTKVEYIYTNQSSLLQTARIVEGVSSNPTIMGIYLEYSNAFDKVSKIQNQFGVETNYLYDEFGRLIEIKNENQKLLQSYEYEYGKEFGTDYILNRIIETSYTNPSDTSKNVKSYQYFDGLARLRQTVTEEDGGYRVSHQDFNNMGFTDKTWNPYLDQTTTNGDFVEPSNARARAKQFYKSKLGLSYDPRPYSRKEYFGISYPSIHKDYPAWTNTEVNTQVSFPYSSSTINGQSVKAKEVTDESGNTIKKHYNYFGELVRTTVAESGFNLNLITDYEYDEVGNLVKTTSPTGLETTYTYNTLGQKTKESLPDMEEDREFRYDDLGRLRFVQDPNQKSSKQNVSHSLSGGVSVSKTIVANSNGKLELDFCVFDLYMDDYTITITDVGNQSVIYYNSFSPDGDCVGSYNNPLTFTVGPGTYTLNGQAADPGEPIVGTNGNFGFESNDIFTYTKYDDLSRPVEIGQYSGGISFNGANANDENFPASGHDPQIKYYYDGDHTHLLSGYTPSNSNGRLTKVSYRDQSTTSGWSDEEYSYNNLGKIEWKVTSLNLLSGTKVIEYQYDDLGRLTRLDYQPNNSADRFITWQEYDDYGRLKYVYTDTDVNISGRRKAIEYIYNADGSVKQKKLGNSNIQVLDYDYTIRGWTKAINDINSIGSDKFAMSLSYAPNGNISQQQWRQPQLNNYLATYSYTYDEANRLKTALFSGSGYNSNAFDVKNLNYNKNGNLTSYWRYNEQGNFGPNNLGMMEVHIESTSNRVSMLREAAIYQEFDTDYDANGNMTKNELNGLSSAQYDWRNMASQMSANGSTLFYAYDANGNRTRKKISSTETHYVRGMNGEVLAVYINDVIKMHNIYASGDIIGNYDRVQRRYFIKDHLGSIRTTVDQNGAVDGYTDYYPFGKTMPGRSWTNQNDPLNINKYTGHERDEDANLTLDYMLARNYDPIIGRFLQIDPLADQFPGWTPYHYVHNNPLNLIDPTGMFSTHTDEDGNIIAAYDDGDLGVYQHSDATTKDEIDKKREKTGQTSGGGEKRGITRYRDEFAVHDNKSGEALKNEDGSYVTVTGRIHFDYKIDKLINDYTLGKSVENYGGLLYLAYQSAYGVLDIKNSVLEASDGYLLDGVYVTGRSAGNYLAGRNAAYARQSWDRTIYWSGFLHSWQQGTSTEGTYKGEIGSAGRWIENGYFDAVKEKRGF